MKSKLTTAKQLQLDRDLYGMSFERQLPDGSTERLDPTTIKCIRVVEKRVKVDTTTVQERGLGGNLFGFL